ncbi:hypothetical protein [Arthrobacter sp. E3]|uniref:hypothetical protein n=1 Tax=Arthrobacter sp. E3 TaxID=517402 RepID=UPI001A94E13B|nr:hypothetical protein [Arthrobacter sp. E3]
MSQPRAKAGLDNEQLHAVVRVKGPDGSLERTLPHGGKLPGFDGCGLGGTEHGSTADEGQDEAAVRRTFRLGHDVSTGQPGRFPDACPHLQQRCMAHRRTSHHGNICSPHVINARGVPGAIGEPAQNMEELAHG